MFFVGLVVIYAILAVSSGGRFCGWLFCKNHFIPDFADGVKATDLKVYFDGRRVKCGETVSMLNARRAPTLKLDVTKCCKNVTVALMTPPNPPFDFNYLVWLVHNVNSKALKKGFKNGGGVPDILEGNIDQGDVRAEYEIKKDPGGGGALRSDSKLIYLIYCQCQYINDTGRFLLKTDKFNFDIKKYAAEHGLHCPVSGFYHTTSETGIPAPNLVQLPGVKVPEIPRSNLPVNYPSDVKLPVKAPPVNLPKIP